MKTTRKLRIGFILMIATILFSILIYSYFRNQRTHIIWIVDQKLSNGDIISIKIDQNYKRLYNFPGGQLPIISIGCDDWKHDLYFNYKGKSFEFQTDGLPFLINIWDNTFFIVILKSEGSLKDKYKPKLHFFKYTDSWQNVRAEEFPKQIAIENLYFTINYPIIQAPETIHDNLDDFIISNTVRLWLRLEKGLEYYQTDSTSFNPKEKFIIDPSFVTKYRIKYIDPFWSDKDFKEYLPVVWSIDKYGNKVEYKNPND
jgi:hypothetical protein